MSQQYDKEFKSEAVRLVIEKGRSVSQVANDLGLSTKTLYAWVSKVKDQGDDAFIGSGNLTDENKQQRSEAKRIRDLEEQVAILKKALRIFAENPR